MSLDPAPDRWVWRYCLFGIGVILLVAGGVLLYVGRSHFEVRALGLVACILAVFILRRSRLTLSRGYHVVDEQLPSTAAAQWPSLRMWLVGVALIALVGVAYALLYQDAVDGYKDVVPVYFFAGSSLAAAAFWAYLIARIL